MKDIKLDNPFKKILYVVVWILIIVGLNVLLWLLILGLSIYGKNNYLNQKKKKWVLNKTYQKFVYIVGIINLIFYSLVILVGIVWGLI